MIHSINNFNLNINLPQLSAKNGGPVSDNFVGVIKYDGKNFVNFNNQKGDFGLQTNNTPNNANVQQRVEVDYNNLPSKNNDRIVILIESPHLDEYKINNLNISGPAMGASGVRFNSKCIDVFNSNIVTLKNALNITSNVKVTFDVYFVNAIQYQCSLGTSPINEGIRDYVFESLWNMNSNSFKNDLIDRLNLLNPKLIINACTKNIKKSCCNGNNITPGLTGFNFSFCSARSHILRWNSNTMII